MNNVAKKVLRGKFIFLNVYVWEEKTSFYFIKLERESEPQYNWKENNKDKNKVKSVNEIKSWFSEKVNKTDKLVKAINKKRERKQINQYQEWKREIWLQIFYASGGY